MSFMQAIKKFIKPKATHNYVSGIDKFLAEFDATHPQKSASQKQEIAKYERVFELRDKPTIEQQNVVEIWEAF